MEYLCDYYGKALVPRRYVDDPERQIGTMSDVDAQSLLSSLRGGFFEAVDHHVFDLL